MRLNSPACTGQRPTVEVDDLGGRIVNLDPVAEFAIFIRQCAVVDRHELTDQRTGREQAAILKRFVS